MRKGDLEGDLQVFVGIICRSQEFACESFGNMSAPTLEGFAQSYGSEALHSFPVQTIRR